MRNPFRRRWAVVGIWPSDRQSIFARTWTRSGATIALADLQLGDLADIQEGLLSWTNRPSYVVSRIEDVPVPVVR